MKIKKLLSVIIVLAMVASLLPMTISVSAEGEQPAVAFRYYDETAKVMRNTKWTGSYTSITSSTKSWTTGWYVADGELTIDERVSVTGDVKLILTDGCKLTVNGGINVAVGQSFTIFAQSEGTGFLKADAGNMESFSGIGGDNTRSGGTVNIYGGKIEAQGGQFAAGIGGGAYTASGNITVYGGNVTANGGGDGSGIGGGFKGNGGTVNVYGGSVVANGGGYGAGIGGGDQGNGGMVNVYGGSVVANGGDDAAGIGGGYKGNGGTVNVYGGSVVANGEGYGAGIGGGYRGNGGTVNISGGIVTATGGYFCKSGIGGGTYSTDNGNITVDKNARMFNWPQGTEITINEGQKWTDVLNGSSVSFIALYQQIPYLAYDQESGKFTEQTIEEYKLLTNKTTLTSGYYVVIGQHSFKNIKVDGDVKLILLDNNSVNAGAINVSEGNSLTIFAQSTGKNMGTLTAQGDYRCAGIDCGNGQSGGTVIIHGGSVTAIGGYNGAGIGGGNGGNGGTVEIYGGKIEANGGYNGAGIGGGNGGNGGTVIIHGGLVSANGGNYGAGIGGGNYRNGGTVNIYGGKIEANGGCDGAGIGGGDSGNGGTVNIYGGNVTAAGNNARSIGRGDNGESDGTLAVSEKLNVINYETKEKIKASDIPNYWTVSLTDPEAGLTQYRKYENSEFVTETCEEEPYYPWNPWNGAVWNDDWYEIDGKMALDTVTVKGDVNLILKDDCELTVTGGINVAEGNSLTIYAQSDGEHMGKLIASGTGQSAGIGSAKNASAGTITIHGGNVTASGDANGAGIGGGYYGNGGNITINGGIVTATGNSSGAGIGGGNSGNGGTITINGGKIVARSYGTSSGIGGGRGGSGGIITISGGEVSATGSLNSAGIGGGSGGGGGTIKINGGVVIANGGSYAQAIGKGVNGSDGTLEIDGDIKVKAAEGDEYIPLPAGKSVSDYRYAKIFYAHIHDFGDYVDNGDGTHSRKCAICGAWSAATEHTIVDGKCTVCTFPYKTINLSDGTEITYDYTRFVIDDSGVLKQYKGSDAVVVIPEGIKQIERDILKDNETIIEVQIPASVEQIGYNAFLGCKALTTVKFAENSKLKIIQSSAFRESGLTEVTIPASAEEIQHNVFQDCASLTSVKFTEGAGLNIWNATFANCPLTEIDFPESVVAIGWLAFENCEDLKSITVNWTDADKIVTPQSSSFTGITDCTLYVPSGTKELYEKHDVWKQFTIVEMNSLAMDVLGNEFFVTPNGKVTNKGVVIVALYDSEDMNRLLDVKVFDIENGDEPEGKFTQSGYVRAYWWSSLSDITPLCEAVGEEMNITTQ